MCVCECASVCARVRECVHERECARVRECALLPSDVRLSVAPPWLFTTIVCLRQSCVYDNRVFTNNS